MKEVDLEEEGDDMDEEDDDEGDEGQDFDIAGEVIMEEDSMDVHAMQQPILNGASITNF